LAWLIRFPQLAVQVNLKQVNNLPERDGGALLAQVIELLQQAPKHDVYFAFDYLCQHGLREILAPIASSDYLWLEASNENHADEVVFARQELEKIINALTNKAPDDEYDRLKERVIASDPSLTDEEKQRDRELLKQKKQ
jgi:DNA primase